MKIPSNILIPLMKSKNPISFSLINYCFGRFFFNQFYKLNTANSKFPKSTVTISFDNDFDEDYEALPQILDLLDKYNIRSSFAVIGKFIEKYPDTHKEILDRGHSLLNHTYSHPDNPTWNPNKHFHLLTFEEQREEIQKCHDTSYKLLNYTMTGYRAPHFGRQYTRNIYKILPELGYKYSSSIKSVRAPQQWHPYREVEDVGEIVEFPISTCPQHPLLTFDSYHSTRQGAHKKDNAFGNLFKYMLSIAQEEKTYFNFYFDPRDFTNENFQLLEEILQSIKEANIDCLNYQQIMEFLNPN